MVLLFNLAIDGDHLLQVLDNLLDPGLGGVHAVAGSLEVYDVAGDAGAREGDNNAAELLAYLAKHLAAAGHKVLVVLRIHGHGVLDDIVKLLDLDLEVGFRLLNRLLGALK